MVEGLGMPGPRRGGRLRASALLLAIASGYPAFAQSPAAAPPAASVPSPVFTIRGFAVSGDNPIGEAETQRALAPFQRSNATLETLQQATAALETALRERGFGLHRVVLPPQELGELVRLEIVKFTIAKVQVEGNKIYSNDNVRRSLPELREGESPNFKRLAVQTAIANENPNKQLQVGLREADEPDRIDAAITVKETPPWSFGASVSNAGSQSSGRDRVTVTAGHSNLFDMDQQILAAYTTSLERMGGVKQLGLAYKAPLYRTGMVVGATYTRSDVVGNFGTFTSTGAGHTLGASGTYYLTPEGGRRSYVTLSFEDKVFDATVINDAPIGVDRRSRPLTLGYAARVESDTAAWGYNLDLAVNSASGAHNDLASYQNEDARIKTVHWKALRGGVNYSAGFAQNWLWSARAQYQYSGDVLISGEQFGLGGIGSVRGTRTDRPITGDKGLVATLEVTTPELKTGLRLLGFVDAGWLGNNSPNDTNKRSSDRLASLGVGLRYLAGAFAASLDYGRIVTGSRVPLTLNSASPRRGDDRLYLNVSWRL